MTQQAHPDSNNVTPPGTSGGGGAPAPPIPASITPVQATPLAPTSPAVAPATPPPFERTPTRKILSADDDSLPDDTDTFEINKTAFKKRLERYSRSQLKQLFGTDNAEEIMQWKTQNEAFQKQAEDARLAQMTEAERYKVQYEKATANEQHWKSQFETLQESFALREQDRQMTAVAQKYANPKCMNFLMMEFASHLQGADENTIGEPQAYADAWFKAYIEQNPEFGIAGQPPPAAAPLNGAPAGVPGLPSNIYNVNPGLGVPNTPPGIQPPVPVRTVQQPITNGVSQSRPANAIPPGNLTQKTLAPGLPNSMSDAEARQWKRDHGYNY